MKVYVIKTAVRGVSTMVWRWLRIATDTSLAALHYRPSGSRSWTISTRVWQKMSGMARPFSLKSKRWVYRWALHAALLHSAQTKNAALKENPPGDQFQHDWGEIEVEVAGQRCRINFSVNILKGSAVSTSSQHQSWMRNTPMNHWFEPGWKITTGK